MEAFSLTQFAVLTFSSYTIYPAQTKVIETPGKLVILHPWYTINCQLYTTFILPIYTLLNKKHLKTVCTSF